MPTPRELADRDPAAPGGALPVGGLAPADDLDRVDPTFLADLRASQTSVAHVARWFAAQGLPVVIPPTFERPTAAARQAYRDQGDLGVVRRVEVKQRGFRFAGVADYPYPTVILSRCAYVDAAHPAPWLYVIVSADFRAALLVDVRATRVAWRRRTLFDRRIGRAETVYECPRELATAVRLPAPPARVP